MIRVGFVGTGTMGNPMAVNLLRAGYGLTVHDRRRESTANLVDEGARWAGTARAVAESSDMTLLSLPGPAEVEDVVTGDEGVLAGAAPGSAVIDLSTNSPAVVQSLARLAAERDVRFLDAPVSGGVAGARRGTLSVMVGGDRDVVEEYRPVLEVIGEKIFHVGDVGAGNVVKLVNNMLFFVGQLATVEALALGAKAGIEPQVLRDVVRASSGNSLAWDYGTGLILKDQLAPRFTVGLAAKDISLATALAEELGVDLPMGDNARLLIERYRDQGFADEDIFAVITAVEKQAGVILRGRM